MPPTLDNQTVVTQSGPYGGILPLDAMGGFTVLVPDGQNSDQFFGLGMYLGLQFQQLTLGPASAMRTTVEDFQTLVERWREETAFHSSPYVKFSHPAYQQIMSFGPEVIPSILKELRENPDDWFYALRLLAREDPASDATDFQEARAAWLEWGYRRNYI